MDQYHICGRKKLILRIILIHLNPYEWSSLARRPIHESVFVFGDPKDLVMADGS